MAGNNYFSAGIFSNLTKAATVITLLSAALVTGCGSSKTEEVIDDPQPKIAGCTGSYIGYASPPSQDVRRAVRDRSLIAKGYDISNLTEEQKNALTGGGGLDGGMYLEGSFAFETDENCNVIAGDFVIFGYPFGISGTVNQDRTFTLSYLGPIVGQVNADNSISGQLQHGGGEEYIHGVLSGTFTLGGKI
jgi:hypothetical protein